MSRRPLFCTCRGNPQFLCNFCVADQSPHSVGPIQVESSRQPTLQNYDTPQSRAEFNGEAAFRGLSMQDNGTGTRDPSTLPPPPAYKRRSLTSSQANSNGTTQSNPRFVPPPDSTDDRWQVRDADSDSDHAYPPRSRQFRGGPEILRDPLRVPDGPPARPPYVSANRSSNPLPPAPPPQHYPPQSAPGPQLCFDDDYSRPGPSQHREQRYLPPAPPRYVDDYRQPGPSQGREQRYQPSSAPSSRPLYYDDRQRRGRSPPPPPIYTPPSPLGSPPPRRRSPPPPSRSPDVGRPTDSLPHRRRPRRPRRAPADDGRN